ncbi:MAG: hypothetical protein ABSE57_02630 [Bryobacteraceae bacterium]|jgi:hypothetical protein
MLDTTNLLWYGSLAVEFLFCIYLIWTKLAKSYPTFTACLGFSILRSLAAMYFMRGAVGALLPLSYTYFWLWSEPVWLLLQLAVALEVHTKMWKDYGAVLQQTRPLLLFALLTALVAAAIPVKAELYRSRASRLIPLMHFEFLVKRYVASVLAIFLILSAITFVVVVREAWKSSILRHEGMLAAYLGIYATACFIIEMEWGRKSVVNGYVAAALTLCFVIWISVFRPQELSIE